MEKFYIYHCEKFEDGMNDFTRKLVESYENDLNNRTYDEVIQLLSQSVFIRNRLYKKNLDDQRLKLIIQQYEIEDNHSEKITFFCFKKILEHGDEYDLLKKDSLTWLKNNSFSEVDIKRMKELIPEESNEVLPEIPDDLKGWLKPCSLQFQATIYESEEWVKKISKDFSKYWQTFRDIIIDIVDDNIGEVVDSNRQIRLVHKNNCSVLYEPFSEVIVNKDSNSSHTVFFLYAHYVNSKPSQQNLNHILDLYPEFASLESMIPFARRAYPDWAIMDDTIWCGIEGIHHHENLSSFDPANLALSGEEEDLLKETELPLFINGQAGSGKSTMLLYLFADFFVRKIRQNDLNLKGSPIFLTYNQYLLEEARRGIISILKNNPNYELTNIEKSEVEKLVYELLSPFQKFIMDNVIMDTSMKSNFLSDKHLNFTKFRQLYHSRDLQKGEQKYACKLKEKELYSPELAWHVIRTFIKGENSDIPETTPEHYRLLPVKDQTVNHETYEGIYNTIYGKWYKHLTDEHRFWDDIDLIRTALQCISEKKHHFMFPVIFCDEAQDFTKVELELLLKLSSYTHYDLSNESHIPLAFAGDPLQTLNPTGFSWKRLKANYYSKFAELKLKKLELKYENLEKNYRSSADIVKLANLIQFSRYKLLGIDKHELKPQNWWQQETGISPCKFIIDKNFSIENLKLAEDTIIIIPCELEDEKKYIESDNALKSIFENVNGEQMSANVFSPSRSKGLEFTKIILYKFGEASESIFPKLLKEFLHNETTNESDIIKASYFFNKLYVALTRPRESLIIIDTVKGDESFWKYFSFDSENCIYDNLINDEDKEIWLKEKLGGITIGRKEQIAEIEEKDPLGIAEELAMKGRRQCDAELMRRAAYFYKKSDKEFEAKICETEAYEFRKDWENAGDHWNKLEKFEKANDCYWKGECWDKLFQLLNSYSGLYPYRKLVADFMLKPSMEKLNQNILVPHVMNEIYAGESIWNTVIDKVKRVLKGELSNNKMNWNFIANSMEQIVMKGFNDHGLLDLIFKYYFRGENWKKSSEFGEKINSTTEEFYWSKAFSANSDEERITWLLKLPYGKSHLNKTVETFIIESLERISIIKDYHMINMIANHFYRGKNLKTAIEIWKKIDRKNRHLNYYWANYEVSDNPVDKIRYLLSLPERGRSENSREIILNIWDDLKKDQEKLAEVFVLNNKFRLVNFLKDLEKYDDAYLLLKNGIHPREWYELILLLEEKKVNNLEEFDIIRAIAYSNLYEDDFKGEMENLRSIERDKLRDFSMKIVNWMKENEYQGLSMKELCEIGCALEKLSYEPYLIGLLKIYSRIIHDDDIPKNVQKWAKERWIYVKEKKYQVDFERNELEKRDDVINYLLMDKEVILRKRGLWKIDYGISEYPGSPPSFEKMIDVIDLFQLLLKEIQEIPNNDAPKSLITSLIHIDKFSQKTLWKESVRNHVVKLSTDSINKLVIEIDRILQ